MGIRLLLGSRVLKSIGKRKANKDLKTSSRIGYFQLSNTAPFQPTILHHTISVLFHIPTHIIRLSLANERKGGEPSSPTLVTEITETAKFLLTGQVIRKTPKSGTEISPKGRQYNGIRLYEGNSLPLRIF